MYHFVDLSEQQKHQRRLLLDRYGAIAQLSVLVPILAVQAYVWSSWLYAKTRTSPSTTEPPGSPYVKAQSTSRPAALSHHWSVFRWWSGEPLSLWGSRLGTKGEVCAAVSWTLWLLLLCFLQTGDDYMHLTKRFGIVAASQLPLHYLLAIKAPYSPLQWLTRCSHERLLSLHQLLGRIVTVIFYLHAIFYFNFYILSGLLTAKLKEVYVLCGIAGILAFTVIGTTALAPVRQWNYRVFYAVHVTLATSLLPVLWFHVSHIRPYLYETALIYVLNVVFRLYMSKTYSGTLQVSPGTDLVDINIPAPTKQELAHWEAGQHAYISLPGHPLLRTFRSNPFTVASIPATHGKLRFIARILDGNTVSLARTAKGAVAQHEVTVEGPYGLRSHTVELLRCDRVLMIAGGIGATFLVPIYKQLLSDLSPSRGSHRRQKVSFVWVVRQQADTDWAIPEETNDRQGFLERLSVHITGTTHSEQHSAKEIASNHAQIDVDDADDEAIELEEQKTLLKDGEHGELSSGSNTHIRSGRPDIARLVSRHATQGSRGERLAVLVCGPSSLNEAVRKEVGKWVYKGGRDIWFHQEAFGT